MKKLFKSVFRVTYLVIDKFKPLAIFRTAVEALDSFFLRKPLQPKAAPHIRDAIDLKRYMITVVFALIPPTLGSIYFFGWRVIVVIAISYIFGVGTEWLFAYFRKEEIQEGAFVTCMIYPLILPPTIPFWMVAVGIVFATVFAKEAFGGTGRNIFNVAMIGRLFLAIAFPAVMTTKWVEPFSSGLGGFTQWSVDSITSATPLINYKAAHVLAPHIDLFRGTVAGSFGETSTLLIILGGIFLLFTRVANWRLTFGYIGSVALFSGISSIIWPETFAPPLFQLLSGGLMFAAVYMITDPVTSPFTKSGKWIYAIIAGIITVIIRNLSGYVEGVMFAVIFMNTFAPLIDHLIVSAKFKEKAAL